MGTVSRTLYHHHFHHCWRNHHKTITRNTEVSEIQGEKPWKQSTPTYSPNAWAELAHFLARDPSYEYFRSSDVPWGFFILSSEPRYEPKIDNFWTLIWPKTYKYAHTSVSTIKFENRLGASESIHMRGLSPKMSQIGLGVWSVGGGDPIFEAFHLVFRSLLYYHSLYYHGHDNHHREWLQSPLLIPLYHSSYPTAANITAATLAIIRSSFQLPLGIKCFSSKPYFQKIHFYTPYL